MKGLLEIWLGQAKERMQGRSLQSYHRRGGMLKFAMFLHEQVLSMNREAVRYYGLYNVKKTIWGLYDR